jgi:outer membrane protein insertion porin family
MRSRPPARLLPPGSALDEVFRRAADAWPSGRKSADTLAGSRRASAKLRVLTCFPELRGIIGLPSVLALSLAMAPALPAAAQTIEGGKERPTTARRPERPPPPKASEERIPVRYVLEAIEVRGNLRTASRVVLRYIPLAAGDVLDVDDPAVELIRYRLLGTGFFREVELSLAKGSREGLVVLIVEVEERNTIVVNDVWMGLGADADTRGRGRPLTAYAGLDVAETNLAGTGITLGGALGVAQDQLALRMRFFDPSFLGTPLMTSGTLLFNDGQDFFGNDAVFFDDSYRLTGQRPDFAIAAYSRVGGSFALGTDLAVPTRLWASYRLERLDARLPSAASHIRGTRGELDREPIDFLILPGKSVLSTLSATLQHDTRDHPVLPTRGWFATFTGEASLAPLGSEYPYTRGDVSVSHWWPLPSRQVLRFEAFGGLISGHAPFFEQYFVGDLSDFRASRVLGLNVERRPVPNFFGTSIAEARYGTYAAKLGGEYRIALYRGSRSVYGIDLFASSAVFALASQRDLSDPPGGYEGLRRFPVDLTANFGFRMDTSAGGFTVAFANALGFLPLLDEGR